MRALLRLLLIGTLVTMLAPARAVAQPPQAVNKKKTAKQYVDAGLAAQEAGDHDTAITFYQKAYELVRHPALIFNIAQAHRLAGRIDQALTLYRRYLTEDPRGTEAPTAREIIAEIEARKVAEARKIEEARIAEARKIEEARIAEARRIEEARLAEVRRAEEARRIEAQRQAEEMRRVDAQRGDAQLRREQALQSERAQPAESPSEAPGVVSAAAPARSPGRSLRISGIVAGGIGLPVLAVGIGFGIRARSLSSDFSTPGTEYNRSKDDAGRRANNIAIGGLVSGSVLVASGLAMYWLGNRDGKQPERVTLAPLVSEQHAGLVVSGSLP